MTTEKTRQEVKQQLSSARAFADANPNSGDDAVIWYEKAQAHALIAIATILAHATGLDKDE